MSIRLKGRKSSSCSWSNDLRAGEWPNCVQKKRYADCSVISTELIKRLLCPGGIELK
jgi:hypothetical protein